LLSLAKRFIIIEYLDKNKSVNSEILYKELINRKQLRLCQRLIVKEKKELKNRAVKNLDFYAQTYQVENGYFNYLNQKGLIRKEDNIIELNNRLDKFYLLKKLDIHTITLSLDKFTKKEYDYSSINALEHLLNLPQYAEEPLIILYRATHKLIIDDNEKNYSELIHLLQNPDKSISQDNLNIFYSAISNFFIAQIRAENFEYYKQLCRLYQLMDEKNILLRNGFMDIIFLKNLISAGCKVNNFEWAEFILDKYINKINHKDKNSVYNLNKGCIEFYEEKYDSAENYLLKVKKINRNYEVNWRMLRSKLLYKQDKEYNERTNTFFRSVEQYVKISHTLYTPLGKSYANFLKLLINLYKLRHNRGIVTKQKVLEKIDNQKFISDKKWLLDELEEIK